MDFTIFLSAACSVLGAIVFLTKLFIDERARKQSQVRLSEAEEKAFGGGISPKLSGESATDPNAPDPSVEHIVNFTMGSSPTPRVPATSGNTVQANNLFNLYNKQIENYQTQTQARASWSFAFAILAMVAGLGLVVWGGTQVLSDGGWQHVAAGSIIAAIGGAVSAFIAKTFLDVHRLSLIQLNHYFLQPVVNTHILTAQRLADQLPDDAKQKAYGEIITKVVGLIVVEPDVLSSETGVVSPATHPAKGARPTGGHKVKPSAPAKDKPSETPPTGGA